MGKKEEYLKREKFIDDLGNIIREAKVKYIGGHPDAAVSNLFGNLFISNSYIGYANLKTPFTYKFIGFKIPMQDIINVEYKNETDIQKDVTLTRMAFMGIYAFAAKKKTVTRHDFLIVTYNESGIENKIVFETQNINPAILVSNILQAKKEQN